MPRENIIETINSINKLVGLGTFSTKELELLATDQHNSNDIQLSKGGFGPVIPDGFGIGYISRPTYMGIMVHGFKVSFYYQRRTWFIFE